MYAFAPAKTHSSSLMVGGWWWGYDFRTLGAAWACRFCVPAALDPGLPLSSVTRPSFCTCVCLLSSVVTCSRFGCCSTRFSSPCHHCGTLGRCCSWFPTFLRCWVRAASAAGTHTRFHLLSSVTFHEHNVGWRKGSAFLCVGSSVVAECVSCPHLFEFEITLKLRLGVFP